MSTVSTVIASEDIEPTLSYIMVRMFMRLSDTKDEYGVESNEYQRDKTNLEYVISGMTRMVLAIPEVTHAHIALSNEVRRMNKLVNQWEEEHE